MAPIKKKEAPLYFPDAAERPGVGEFMTGWEVDHLGSVSLVLSEPSSSVAVGFNVGVAGFKRRQALLQSNTGEFMGGRLGIWARDLAS